MFEHKSRRVFGSIISDEDEQPTRRPWFSTDSAPDADPPPRTTGSAAAAAAMYSGMYDGPSVQRDGAGALDDRAPAPDQLVPFGGRPLDGGLRRDMEQRLGASFADVRIHEDSGRAAAMKANAYTVGENIVFDSGMFDPASDKGRHRIAHELAHVVQQRSGPVSGTLIGNGINLSNPGDEHERSAHEAADRAMGGAPPAGASWAAASGGGSSGTGAAMVQRDESDEKNPLLDKAKDKLKDYLGDKDRLGKVAGPVMAAGGGLIDVARANDPVDRVIAAEKGFKGTVGAIGSALGGKGGKEIAEAIAQKGIDYKRQVFPFQGDVDASGEGISGDVTGGNPHTDAPRDAAGNIDNGTQIVTEDGRIIDKATGEDLSGEAPTVEELKARDKEQENQ